MKRHLFFLILLLLATFLSASSSSQQITKTPQPTQPIQTVVTKMVEAQTPQEQVNAFLTALFPDPKTTYPELSKIDDAVTLIYDTTLGLPPSIMDSLRRFYAFLKENAVNEQLATIQVTQDKKQIPLTAALANATEQLEISQHHGDREGIQTWQAALDQLNATKAAAITKLAPTIIDACRSTVCWQNHLKIFLANSFTYEVQLLGNVNQDEIKMFTFIPQFESAYYSDIYKKLRNDAEYVRIFLVMTDTLRQRVIQQCNDWKNITDPDALYHAIETFKESDFYLFAKQFEIFTSQPGTPTPLTHFSLASATGSAGPAVAKGYSQYLSVKSGASSTIVAVPGLEPLFSIANNTPSLTPLGSFLLTEQVIKPLKGDTYYGLVQTTNFHKLFTEDPDTGRHTPTALFLQLLSFTAINMLNQNNSYLFNSANLADTMQRLDKLKNNATADLQQFPNLIFYQPEDQLYLEDINELTPLVVVDQNGAHATPAGFFSSIGDFFKSLFDRLCHILKPFFEKVGKFIWHKLKTAGNFIVGVAEEFGHYVQTGLAAFANGVVYAANQTKQGITTAAEEMAYATAQFGKYATLAITKCEQMTDEVIKAAEQGIHQVAGILGKVVAFVTRDPQLGDDLAGLIDSVYDLVLDAVDDAADFLIEYYGDFFKLTAEAVMVIGTSVVAAACGDVNALENVNNQFAQDLVNSTLNCVSIVGKFFTDALKNLMVGLAYLVAALTDIVTDLSEAFAAFGVLIATGNPEAAKDAVESVKSTFNAHRRLISAIVGTVLMIVVTIVTLGSAGPLAFGMMAALTIGMMVPALIGANQQDMDAMSELKTQEDFLAHFAAYVAQSGPAQKAVQASLSAETDARLKEQLINADRGLVYYQNYVNNSLNSTRAMQAYQQSSFYNLLSTPDTTNYPKDGILPADPGYSYGIKTNRIDLNPSQGLRLYSAARGTFAQEIATLPAPLQTPEQTTNSFSPAVPASNVVQHFITQKDLANFTVADKTVTVRWRVIYESAGDFYIGIYLNKNYLDTAFLNFLHQNFEQATQTYGLYDQQSFDKAWQPLKTLNRFLFNFDYFAQAFVCYRNSDTDHKPALGVYQHLGQGFITSNNQLSQDPWFERGTWYVMTATQYDKEIRVTFAKENSSVSWNRTIPIQPLPTDNQIPYQKLMADSSYNGIQKSYSGSFGIITSGAAVEYQILQPTQTVVVSAARQASNTTVVNTLNPVYSATAGTSSPASELQREQQWSQTLEQHVKPTFGSWKLVAYTDLTVAQGTYVYRTNSTNIGLKAPLSDFVVGLQGAPGASNISTIGLPLLTSGAQLGQPITNATPLLISLVTGNCYNQQGTLQLTYPDALAAFQQQHPVLPSQLLSDIAAATQAFYAKEVGPFVFANAHMTGVLSALKADVFVYTCPSFTQHLPGLDYLIFVNIPSAGKPGMSQSLMPLQPKNSITHAISLVTGTPYTLVANNVAQNALPTNAATWKTINLVSAPGPSYPNIASTYQAFLDQKTFGAIQNQANAYKLAKEAAEKALLAAQLNPPPPPPPLPAPPPAPVPSLTNLNLLLLNSAGTSSGGGISFSG